MKTGKISDFFTHLVLILASFLAVMPFLWMILTALKPDGEMLSPNWIPHHFEWDNFIKAWKSAPFGRYFTNSIIVTVCAVIGQIVTSAMAGFAFSKIRFLGKNLIFFAILGALMVPLQAIIVPVYLLLAGLGWTNSLTGLIVPMIPSAFGTFLFKQFFDDIPTELEEAAYMDGAGRWRILVQIFLPLSKPVITAFGILAFLFNWNNFFYALIVVSKDSVKTIPLGLAAFSNGHTTDINLMMAASAMAILPIIIIFAFVQRYFVDSAVMSGVK